eukprot:CAMPEP_0198268768 /NCGR_PEP_ID=MMETSP1447-20131203/38723_1 /TAXON_ID=420782 /ORGANISM="Chaetoceros dichaeta, Strain CCMP1751" /LENGTH=48 /DNA_ID= /DNA_START= /DNA_END= /DNA_ORIENTATION=
MYSQLIRKEFAVDLQSVDDALSNDFGGDDVSMNNRDCDDQFIDDGDGG